MTPALTITTTSRPDGSRVLAVVGEIDMSNNDVFAAAVAKEVTAGGPLVVDLTAVEYLDSSALHSLFAYADDITVRTGPLLRPVLAVSGLAQLTTVEEVP
ncbi:STAS domain-containing protein [Actinosynnema sp. NPDC053489]|uniref:STAS domain-containing protein n=1 Tax=Actinosynnema sp. NPDC053489 TaxID=3363916 RepID=UPI0037CA8DA3